jgi:hypothetical protein
LYDGNACIASYEALPASLADYRIESVMVAPEAVAVVGVATVGAEMVGVVAAVVVVLYE